MRRNHMGPLEYLMELAFCGLMGMLWYRSILFRPVLGWSSQHSRLLLWALLGLGMVVGVAVTFRRRRNWLSLLVIVLLPFEGYAILTYGRYFAALCTAALCTGGVLWSLYSLWVLSSPVRAPDRRKTIYRRRIQACLRGGCAVLALCATVVLAAGFHNAMEGGVLIRPTQRAQDGSGAVEEDTIANHMETLCLLEEERWTGLSELERLDVLQVVANIERRYLGIPHEVPVGAGTLDEGTLGQYNPVTYQIVLSLDHLAEDDVEEVLDTVLHECYHAYQRAVVELYGESAGCYRDLMLFRAAQIYAQELGDYQNAGEDGENFSGYYTQRFERDARIYAEESVADYYNRIDLYRSGEVAS